MPTTKSKKTFPPFKLDVELTLITEQLGTVPKQEEIFTTYIRDRAKGKETKDEFKSPLHDYEANERELRGWTGFMEDQNGPFIMDYMVKGFIKNAGNIMKDKVIPVKNLRSKIDDFIFVTPRKIYFDGEKGPEPLERSLRVMTMQGPRVSLAKSDYIEAGAKLKFSIECPFPSEIDEKHVLQMLDYGKFMGLGQFRNGGYGRFSYKITSRSKIGLDEPQANAKPDPESKPEPKIELIKEGDYYRLISHEK